MPATTVSDSRRLILAGLLLNSLLLFRCTPQREDAIYLLPNAFEGNVVLVFDQPNGTPVEYLNGCRVYRIPSTGILKTKFISNPSGYAVAKFCYATQFTGAVQKTGCLPYINTIDSSVTQLPPETVVCFRHNPITQGKIRSEAFTVSRIAKVDSIFEHRDDLIDQALLSL